MQATLLVVASESRFHVVCVRFIVACRKKGKRKREEAEAAAKAQEAALEDKLSSEAAADGAHAEGSGSDGASGKSGAEGDGEEASKELDDLLTPAQRRFREKQLEREVRFRFSMLNPVSVYQFLRTPSNPPVVRCPMLGVVRRRCYFLSR